MSKVSDMVREGFKKSDDVRDAGLSTPADIVRYDDIVYGADPKWQVWMFTARKRMREKGFP